ncbi:MAG: hypothetical protein HYT09_03745 [Candidatus Levybacteria bacterium]|nr:hypothetical protein [Candidatus Levybacteria bacterium]
MKIRLVILITLLIALGAVLSSDRVVSNKDEDGNREVVKKTEEKSTQKTVSPTPTTVQQNTYSGSDFIYPGSLVTSSGGNTFVMTSSDGSDKITIWYTDRLGNYSAKSFVRTKSNGNVLNKLSASSGGQKIQVEITQSASSNTTNIKVEIK